MQLFRLSQVRALLQELKTYPKKALSQNFLIDQNILDKILLSSTLKEGDLVLEIGPGLGAMTERLLDRGAQVMAIEKDALFIPHLRTLDSPSFTLVEGDALSFPFEEEIEKRMKAGQRAKVIANIPYHLTTPLLERFLPLRSLFSSLSFLMQKEVAKRCTAKEGSKEYGSLSLLIRYYAIPSLLFDVSPTCFYPKPEVLSSLLHLQLCPPPVQTSPTHFFTITRTAFQQRRKMIRSSLRSLFSDGLLEETFRKLGLQGSSRPEELSLEEFAALSRALFSQEEKKKDR